MAEEKKTKAIVPIDPKDVATVINTIVDLLESVDASREFINGKIKYLKDTYGISATNARAAAMAIKKQNIEELDEKARAIQELIDICIS